MRDVDLQNVDANNGDWTAARLRGVTVRDCRLTGLDLGGAELRDVIFENCRLGWASFHLRGIRLAAPNPRLVRRLGSAVRAQPPAIPLVLREGPGHVLHPTERLR